MMQSFLAAAREAETPVFTDRTRKLAARRAPVLRTQPIAEHGTLVSSWVRPLKSHDAHLGHDGVIYTKVLDLPVRIIEDDGSRDQGGAEAMLVEEFLSHACGLGDDGGPTIKPGLLVTYRLVPRGTPGSVPIIFPREDGMGIVPHVAGPAEDRPETRLGTIVATIRARIEARLREPLPTPSMFSNADLEAAYEAEDAARQAFEDWGSYELLRGVSQCHLDDHELCRMGHVLAQERPLWCVGYVFAARNPALSGPERIAILERAADVERLHLERSGQDEHTWWGDEKTRDLMCLHRRIADISLETGDLDRAIRELRNLLDLNPIDHQANRYPLLAALLARGTDDDLVSTSAVIGQFRETVPTDAMMAYCAALLAFRKQGDSDTARVLREQAWSLNPFVRVLAQGACRSTRVSSIAQGGVEEAILFLTIFHALRRTHPEAITWLAGSAGARSAN